MTRVCSFARLAAACLAILISFGFAPGTASAEPGQGAACVREFFIVARVDLGLSPAGVVELLNTDGDPIFQVDNVGHLRQRVANAEIGIFDTTGVYHICPNPT